MHLNIQELSRNSVRVNDLSGRAICKLFKNMRQSPSPKLSVLCQLGQCPDCLRLSYGDEELYRNSQKCSFV